MRARYTIPAIVLAVAVALGVYGLARQEAVENTTPIISPEDLLERIEASQDLLVLDVRTQREFDAGRVPGAVLVPHTEIADRLGEIIAFRDKPVVVYCQVGGRASRAESLLRELGFTKVLHLEGDWRAWSASNRPIEK